MTVTKHLANEANCSKGSISNLSCLVRLLFVLELFLNLKFAPLTLEGIASSERIPCITRQTTAYRAVIDNLALRIETASSWTRVDAFLVDASLILGAIRADGTFGLATRWTSEIVG